MTTQQYIGARYVPIFGRKDEESIEWDNSKTYEPLTIVLHEGNSYTSRQFVPVGIDIKNEDFWALTGNYNAQVEAYRQEVQNVKSLAETNKEDIATNKEDIATNKEDIATNKQDIATNKQDIANIDANLNALHANTVSDAQSIYTKITEIRYRSIEEFGGSITNDDNSDIFANIPENTYLILQNGQYKINKPIQINFYGILCDKNSEITCTNNMDTAITINNIGNGKYDINLNCDTYTVSTGIEIKNSAANQGGTINCKIKNATDTGLKITGSNGYRSDNISITNGNGHHTNIGVLITATDNQFGTIVPVNCNIGVKLSGGNTTIKYLQPWAYNYTGSEIGLQVEGSNHKIVTYVVDTLKYAINPTNSGELLINNISTTHNQSISTDTTYILHITTKTGLVNQHIHIVNSDYDAHTEPADPNDETTIINDIYLGDFGFASNPYRINSDNFGNTYGGKYITTGLTNMPDGTIIYKPIHQNNRWIAINNDNIIITTRINGFPNTGYFNPSYANYVIAKTH